MEMQKYLEKLGLDKEQQSIYLELSRFSEITVVKLSRIVKIPRSSLYIELDKLIQKGLVVAYKENKTTVYKVTSPESVKSILVSEQHKVKDLFEGFDDFVSTITQNQSAYKKVYSVNIYNGQIGVKQLLWNILSSGAKEVVGFSPGTLDDIVDREFAENWRLEFKLRGMHNKIILNETVPLNWSNVPGFLIENVEAKTLEEKKIKFDREVLIYKDTLAVISKKDDPEQYGVEICDRLLVSSYRQMFDLLWNEVAKKV
jgi:sugar-specific transcriptional regulator TrmB